MTTLSLEAALDGVIEDSDDRAYVLDLVETHRTWGGQKARVPTHILVNLVMEIKKLREQQLSFYKK